MKDLEVLLCLFFNRELFLKSNAQLTFRCRQLISELSYIYPIDVVSVQLHTQTTSHSKHTRQKHSKAQLPVCLVLFCADDWSVWLARNVRGRGLCRLWCYWLLTSFGFPPSQCDLELLFSAYIDWYPQSPAASQISLQNKATENEQKTTFRPNYSLPGFFSCSIKDLINRLFMLFPERCAHNCFSVVFFFSLQNNQSDYVICGVKLPNSEDFQGKFGVWQLKLKTFLSFDKLIK